jgi:hypothetical protein
VPDADILPQADPSTSAEASAPESTASDEPIGYSRGSFEDVFSKAFDWSQPTTPEPAVSNGELSEDDEGEPEPAGEKPAEPSAAASVTPEEQPPAKPLSRREQERQAHQERIAALEAENTRLAAEREADLQKARDEARALFEADQRRQTTEAEQRAIAAQEAADVERYQRLLATPDDDLFRDDPEGYTWREERKALLKKFPQVEAHHRAQASRFVDAKLAELNQQQNAFWIDVRSQMASAATRNGIDPKDWEQSGVTWDTIALAIEQAADARATERVTADLTGKVQAAEAEVLKVKKELQDAHDQLLGLTKAPSLAGRSQTATDEKAKGANYRGSWQENLAAAFG